jgi:phosphoglycolate phosphatase
MSHHGPPHRGNGRPGYRHVFFDFDGVLCNSLSAAIKAFNELRTEFPSLPSPSDQNDMVTVYGGSLKTCLSRWLTDSEHQAFFDRHSEKMSGFSDELELFPGVSELVDALEVQSASLVTSAYSDHVCRVFRRALPAVDPGRFYAIAGREEKQTKAAKIGALTKMLGLKPDQCLYVGDLESDILYCRDVPIDIMAVTYGYHPRWYLATLHPTYIVDSVAELRATLVSLLAEGCHHTLQ